MESAEASSATHAQQAREANAQQVPGRLQCELSDPRAAERSAASGSRTQQLATQQQIAANAELRLSERAEDDAGSEYDTAVGRSWEDVPASGTLAGVF